MSPLLRSLAATMLFAVSVGAQSTVPIDYCAEQVVALVGGDSITIADLHRDWQARDPSSFARLQQQLFEVHSASLDRVIEDALLSREAARRQLTKDQVLRDVESRVAAPTADEIRRTYEASSAAAQQLTFEQATAPIREHLTRQKIAAARGRRVDDLRQTTPVTILRRFDPPRQQVKTTPRDPAMGASAGVEIVEFSDFECPYCRQAVPVFKQLVAKYGDRLRLVWKDFPLPIHASARATAEAAQCANDQGRFWQYHDILFANQGKLSPVDLRAHATAAGLERREFDLCLESATHRDRVADSVEQGRSLGVRATPTVFINGRMVTGASPFEAYEKIVLEELAADGAACSTSSCSTAAAKKE